MSTKPNPDTLYEDTGGGIRLKTVHSAQDVRAKYYLDLSGSTDAMMPRAGDVGLLKLISPELEKYMAQNGAVVTTPTPTTQIFYPKAVTEEQEAYARGFIDALAKLHQRQSYAPPPTSTLGVQNNEREIFENIRTDSSSVQSVTFNLAQSIDVHVNNSGNLNNTLSFPTSGGCLTYTIGQNQQVLHCEKGNLEATTVGTTLQLPIILKEEPQTVPCLDVNRPESPICERLEIKRARNRLAAQRCRGRKLERIVVLSERVSVLKGENAALEGKSATLKKELAVLRRELINHVDNGCHVVIGGGEQNLSAVPRSILPCASSSSDVRRLNTIGSDCTNSSSLSIPCDAMVQSEGMSYSVVPQQMPSDMPQAMSFSPPLSHTLSSFNFFVLPSVATSSEFETFKQEASTLSTIALSQPIMTLTIP